MQKIIVLLALLATIAVFAPGQGPKESTPPPNLSISTGNQLIDGYVTEAAERYDLDPLLIISQIKQESDSKTRAVSHKGAKGLMQLMPATAKRFGVKNIFDPKQNIEAGAKYMRFLLDEFDNDVDLALAGYNAGEGAVKKHGNRIPPYRETRKYVKNVLAFYEQAKSETEQTASL